MKAYADKEDLCQKKKPVSGEIRKRIIQRRVKIHREMRREIVEESENVIIHSQYVRIVAMLSNLLEVVDNATDNPGEFVTQNGKGHASWCS
jgi:hypothetical protein